MTNIAALLLLVLLHAVPAGAPNGRPEQAQPEIVGPGVLSAGEVYRGCFSADGRTFYFFKKITPQQEDYRIFVSQMTGGRWSEPQRLDLGGEYSDLYPAISRDGGRLVFSSYRPAPGDTSEKRNAHLWYADRVGGRWGAPVFIASVNTLGHYHSWVEFGPDGALYFRRATPDWTATQTLTSRWNGRTFATPVVYDLVERWKTWRPDVRVAGGSPGPDSRTVFLDVATRNPETGRAASDIWVSQRKGNRWTDPAPLRAGVNTSGFDVFPFFSPDRKTLYFVRDFKAFYRVSLAAALPGD
jgi:hypothetical protein